MIDRLREADTQGQPLEGLSKFRPSSGLFRRYLRTPGKKLTLERCRHTDYKADVRIAVYTIDECASHQQQVAICGNKPIDYHTIGQRKGDRTIRRQCNAYSLCVDDFVVNTSRPINIALANGGANGLCGKCRRYVAVECQRVNTLLVRREPVGNASMDRISRLVRGMCQEGISALAFDQRDDGAPVSLADDRVAFPIPDTTPAIDDSRAILDRDLVGDAATTGVATIAFAPLLTTAQIAV